MISSPTSIALNRLAIGHAASRKSNLGGIVLANGRFAIGERLRPVLEAGREAGLLDFDDAETAFRTFFGLVGRDVQIRLLLGDALDTERSPRSSATPPGPPTSSSHFTGGRSPHRKPEEPQPKEGLLTCAFITIVMPTST